MENPVEMDDHYTYEKEAIIKWLSEHSNESPITHQKISTTMKENTILKERIQKYINDQSQKIDGNLQIFVKNINDKTFVLQMNENDTIEKLQSNIKDKSGIPENEQRLLYMGKHLKSEGNKTLKDYNVINNSTVHLLLRLMGG